MENQLKEMCARIAGQLDGGHSEKIYQEALAAELRYAGWMVELERVVPVMYKPGDSPIDISVGFARLDILATKDNQTLLIELKSTASFSAPALRAQIQVYLKGLGGLYHNMVGYGIQFMQPGYKEVAIEDMVQLIVVSS